MDSVNELMELLDEFKNILHILSYLFNGTCDEDISDADLVPTNELLVFQVVALEESHASLEVCHTLFHPFQIWLSPAFSLVKQLGYQAFEHCRHHSALIG